MKPLSVQLLTYEMISTTDRNFSLLSSILGGYIIHTIYIYYLKISLPFSALESSNTTVTDGKEDSGPKSFLLPSLFPITTPLNSPRDVSPARNYEIQQRRKVRFQFVKSIQPDVSL